MVSSPGDNVELSMIGTLPPLKGISPYCAELVSSLSEHVSMEFVDFKKLYPERLYPGGTRERDLYPIDLRRARFSHKKAINFFNPLSWVKAGIDLRGNVVHAQWWTGILAPAYYTILTIAKLKGKKIVLTVHNVEPHEDNPVLKAFNRSILRLGDEFIVHNESNREKISTQLGRNHAPVHVIPHIPFRSARTETDTVEKERVRRELGITNGKRILIFFGNIREYKGLDVLLKAFPSLARTDPDLMLMVVGQPWVKWEQYDRIIRDEGIAANMVTNLRYLPFDDLRKHILASDLAVFPFKSLDSASGSVVLARSMGKPVVVSEVGCADDIRGDGVFFSKPGCPDSLADTIDRALRYLESEKDSSDTDRPGDFDDSCREIVADHLQVYSRI